MAESSKYFTAFEVYKRYIALKKHFDCGNSYDFVKYNGKTKNLKEESFRKRKDSHFFFKLSRKVQAKNLIHFLLANFSVKNSPWIGDLLDSESNDIYHNWLNRIQYLESHFEYQFSKLLEKSRKENDHELLKVNNQMIPSVFTHYENEIISCETLMILDMCLNICERTRRNDRSEMLQFTNFPGVECKIHQYQKFFENENDKYLAIIKNVTQKEK